MSSKKKGSVPTKKKMTISEASIQGYEVLKDYPNLEDYVNDLSFGKLPPLTYVRDSESFDLLVENGADTDFRTDEGKTLLDLYKNRFNNKDLDQKTYDHILYYYLTRLYDYYVEEEKKGKTLFTLGTPYPSDPDEYFPILFHAIRDDNVSLARALINSGANPDITDIDRRIYEVNVPGQDRLSEYDSAAEDEYTDLVAFAKSPEMLQVLVDGGARIDGVSDELLPDEELPIYQSQNEEVFDKFIELGSKVRDPEAARKHIIEMIEKREQLKKSYGGFGSYLNESENNSSWGSYRLPEIRSNEQIADSFVSGNTPHGMFLFSDYSEEKSVLEYILEKTNSMKKVLEAVNKGVLIDTINSRGQFLTDIVRDNPLRVKILLQHGAIERPWMREIPLLKNALDQIEEEKKRDMMNRISSFSFSFPPLTSWNENLS
jgi:hypothetical protein